MSHKIFYTLEYSDFIKNEFKRLEFGNDSEKQRFRNARTATVRVLQDPLAHTFKKNLPENYKAVNVLQQYRLFFKIINIDYKNSVIFFTWINNEESLHVNGSIDDAYEVFKNLLQKNQIETYSHVELEDSKYYIKIHNKWGEDHIYSDLNVKIQNENLHANSYLNISKTKEKEYRLNSISTTRINFGLRKKLLSFICNEAKENKYIIYYELNTNLSNVEQYRHIFEVCGFTLEFLGNDLDDEIEIWTTSIN
ncbi:MAG: type II toxin-antitoxin system YhaV family toxin [Thiohalomonadales bacterium]